MQKTSYPGNLIYLTAILFVITCCKKDNVLQPVTAKSPEVITGIQMRDERGNPLNVIGTPNIKVTDTGDRNYNYSFSAFPNPNYSFVCDCNKGGISIFVDARKQITNATLWIEKAVYRQPTTDTYYTLDGNFFQANNVILVYDSINVSSGGGIARFIIETENIEPGVYRAYLKINDVLLWDNIAININPESLL